MRANVEAFAGEFLAQNVKLTEDAAFFDVGVNYWPLHNVVFKADVQFTDFADSSKDEEIINLGIGYHF